MTLNLVTPQFHSLWNGYGGGPILMNETYCVRRNDDMYGRGITQLRKSLTNDDTEPFPVI